MESLLENDTNETTKGLNEISIEDLQSQHRKERKELQAKIQALKKNAPKSDKKKRKEALDEIAKLESELEKKQQLEIKQAGDEIKSVQVRPVEEEPSDDNDNELLNNISSDTQPHQRVTKAQKRRDKKAREARQKEEEIQSLLDDVMYSPKAIETRKLQTKLKERQLALYHIPSDGDCLYNAIRHQLMETGLPTLTIKALRSETANYIQANKKALIPYMTHPESGDLLTDEQFEKYCDDIRHTSSWGGHIELKALSSILKTPIEVLQAEGSPTMLGDEFGGASLVITYHRHMYSLGEHYNSTMPLAEAPNDDDSKENADD